MIVKNEEDTIGDCLSSVKDVVDEIVIVDTGSTDKTKEIVSEFTDKIYDFTWIDDFSAARNESFSHATKEYIMWLDADDILKPEDAQKLKDLKETLSPNVDVVHFIYNYGFDDKGNVTLSFYRERLVKRIRNFKWVGFIHEYIATMGTQLNSDIIVTHCRVHGNPDRNINIYRKKLEEGYTLTVRDYYYYGRELYYHRSLDEAIEVLSKFLTLDGWIEDRLSAIISIGDCYIWKGEYDKAREILLKGLGETIPRAEMVYRIGTSYLSEGKYEQAIFWYEMIFNIQKPTDVRGFVYDEYWTWKPHLQLCLCYSKMGDNKRALEENKKAATYVPDDSSVLHNFKYFATLNLE